MTKSLPHLTEERQAIMLAALEHIPFDGWSREALRRALKDLGKTESYERIAFPDGVSGLIQAFLEHINGKMEQAFAEAPLTHLPVRERVHKAVMLRLQLLLPYRQVVSRLAQYWASPLHMGEAFKSAWNTADIIWYAAGDTATDFNYYSKRTLLAGVYASTLTYWLTDTSENQQNTHEFLSRRIADVLKLGKAHKQAEECFAQLVKFFS